MQSVGGYGLTRDLQYILKSNQEYSLFQDVNGNIVSYSYTMLQIKLFCVNIVLLRHHLPGAHKHDKGASAEKHVYTSITQLDGYVQLLCVYYKYHLLHLILFHLFPPLVLVTLLSHTCVQPVGSSQRPF